MLSVGELKKACEHVEKEYGSDSNVILQIYDLSGRRLIVGANALSCGWGDDGTLFLTNTNDKEK